MIAYGRLDGWLWERIRRPRTFGVLGLLLGAFLFGSLLFGTTNGLQSGVIPTELAGNLTSIIQGMVVLFVGADVLILYVWNTRRKLRKKAATA